MMQQSSTIATFCCYARKDTDLLYELKTHLSPLQRRNVIDVWHDGDISAGTVWEEEIKKHLNEAKFIFLLISADFINSDYCYSTEMHRALERHKRGEVRVIPIILRPVGGWEKVPPGDIQLGQLQALPKDAKPVTSWTNRDEVWKEVVEGIERAINESLMGGSVPPVKPRPSISRRAVLTGLGATAAVGVASGSIAWLTRSFSSHPSATPTAPPTSIPVGWLLYTYGGHTDAVNTVAWSHDGKRVSSGSDDTTVQVWDALTGHHPLIYHGHSKGVNAVAWSPDGKHLASASDDNTAQVWDVTGKTLLVYRQHKDNVRDVAWSPPDGRYIASASWDGTVQIWDTATEERFLTYNGHAGYEVYGVAWSPDGKYIASSGNDATVQVWDPTNSTTASQGKSIYTYRGHDSNFAVNRVAWSPDSRRVASASYDGTAQVWDAITGGNRITYANHKSSVLCVAWSPNNQDIASGSDDQTMQVWNAVTRDVLHTYTGHTNRVKGVAWSPNGKFLVTASDDTKVMIWRAP